MRFIGFVGLLVIILALHGCAGSWRCEPTSTAAVGQGAEQEPNLLLEGAGEIPDELREHLRPYLNTRRSPVGDISADGQQLLITTRFGETAQIHMVSSPLGAREQLSFLTEPAMGPSFVPGRSDQLVYVADQGGNESYRLFLAHRSTGKTRPLSPTGGRVAQYLWWGQGSVVAFNSNARDGKNMDIYVVDVAADEPARKLVDGVGHWSPMAWSADGSKLLVREYVSIQESRLHLIDVKTGSVESLTDDGVSSAYRDAAFSADGGKLFVVSDRSGDFHRLMELDLGTGQFAPVGVDHGWNVEELAMSSDGSQLAYTVNEGGYSRLYLYQTTTGETTQIEAIPDGIVHSVHFARDVPRLAFTLASPLAPPDAYTFDLGESAVVRWTRSEIGGLRSEDFVAPELIEYPTFDGRRIPAFYYKPSGDGPFPVVVRIHGGPEAQSRPYFTAYVQYLVRERGVAVLVPNVRGSDGYGKTYLGLDNGLRREDSVKDIGALLDWIAANKVLDEARVAVVGGSYGGYMVLASLIHYSDRLAAGIDVVGISSFVTFLENTKAYRRDLRRAEYGDEREPKIRAFFDTIDPLHSAHKIRSPLFVAQGANDPRVPASEAEQIVEAVRGTGADVWYMLARNEGHGFRKKTNKDTYLYLMILFLERHLALDAK